MKQQKPDAEIISKVMSYVGSFTSEKKKLASKNNGIKGGGRPILCHHDFQSGERGGTKCAHCGIYKCRRDSSKRFLRKKKVLNELSHK